MNKFFKLALVAALMTMIFAVPVLADDDRTETMISSESTDQLVIELDAYNLHAMGQVLYVGNYNNFALPNGHHAIRVSRQVKNYDILCCDNHKLYLRNVLSAAQTDLANKQTQYNSVAAQAKEMPTYAQMLPDVQAQLVAAQQKVVVAQNNIILADQKLAKYYAEDVY